MLAPSFTTIATLAFTLFSTLSAAQAPTTQKVGWTGTLSTLDGGLGGKVTVVDPTTLMITSYTLKDASAPALYWWGTTTGALKDGFRISSKQVTEAAKTNTLTISLDSGKTTADFTTVGLWCERLSANFGQATLMASGTDSTTPSSSSTPASTSPAAAATTSAKSGAGAVVGSYKAVIGSLFAATLFATLMG